MSLKKKNLSHFLIEQKSVITLCVLIVIISLFSENFFSLNNLFNILQQNSINAIIAVGMTLVILTSGIDLSVGSLLALMGAIAATIVGADFHPVFAVLGTLCAGAIIGATTGTIIAKGNVQAFIATLVMMMILRGMTMLLTKGEPISTGITENSDLFSAIGISRPLGIPAPIWLMIIVFISVWYLLTYTRLGRYIYAIGGNESAARLSGINVTLVKIMVYGISGLTCALASTIEVARLSSAQPNAGTGYELDAIAAVVLGGTSLAGGKGKILGTFIGILILGVLNNGLNMLNIDPYIQMVVKGGVILLAVLIDNNLNK